MTTGALRQNVFICYSHADAKYLKYFELKLQPAVGDKLSIWSDEKIAAGADWHTEIERHLGAASAALLLVSDTFLSSSYINNVELPAILERHARDGLDVYWVPLSSLLNGRMVFSALQAAWPPERPLMSLSKKKRDEAVKTICEKVLSFTGQLTYVSDERRDRLLREAERALPPEWALQSAEAIGDGDFSIVYRAQLADREVALKVLVECPLQSHLKGFATFVQEVRELSHPAVAPLHHAILGQHPRCLVLEYVKAPCLGRHLRSRGRAFETDEVVTLIAGLARALHEYHARGLSYGPLTSNDVFYDQERHLLRVSAVGISSFLAANDPVSAGFPRGPVAATYMVPEQYLGASYGPSGDQYSLGLIAFEMLEGAAPVTVTCPADLEQKRRFFRNPQAFAGGWAIRHPRLAAIIFQMLAENPARRWESMLVLADQLAHLECEAIALAKASYCRCCQNSERFYGAFYERLFGKYPELRAYFPNLGQQYAKLDGAIQFLLNFTDAPRIEPTVLTGTAERHRHMRITPAQFDAFAQSFLDTLAALGESALVVEAWRLTFRPGLEYLKQTAASAPTIAPAREVHVNDAAVASN